MEAVHRNQRQLGFDGPLPGPLCGEVCLRLHSIHAALLVKGRSPTIDKPQITGLIGFARLLRPIWLAAAEADVLAYAYLFKVEKALARVDRSIRELTSAIDAKQLSSGFHSACTRSVKPANYELSFEVPYAFEAAQHLARFDDQAVRLMTCARMAQVSRPELHQLVKPPAKALRGLFATPLSFPTSPKRDVDALETYDGLGVSVSDLSAGRLPRHLPSGR